LRRRLQKIVQQLLPLLLRSVKILLKIGVNIIEPPTPNIIATTPIANPIKKRTALENSPFCCLDDGFLEVATLINAKVTSAKSEYSNTSLGNISVN